MVQNSRMLEKLIALINYSLRRLVNQSFGYGFGSLMAIVVIFRLTGGKIDFLLGCIYVFLLALGVYHMLNFFNIRKQVSEMKKQLTQAPEEVVWVYRIEKEVMPFGVMVFKKSYYCLGLTNGKSMIFPLLDEVAHPFKKEMYAYLSHATFGHSVENEQLFRAEPELLRK